MSALDTPSLSLVIPCYNEAKSLPALLSRCAAIVAARPDAEVVLVDNGSSDTSPEMFRELLPKYPGCRSVRVEKTRATDLAFCPACAPQRGVFWGGPMPICRRTRLMH